MIKVSFGQLYEYIKNILNFFTPPEGIDWLVSVFRGINWVQIIKLAAFFALGLVLAGLLLLLNGHVFEYYNNRRTKYHQLTVTNNGNTPSVFLLRPVDLPKSLAIRFRVGDNPMIWVSRDDKKKKALEKNTTQSEAEKIAAKPENKPFHDSLIPNLDDPLKSAYDTGRKAAGEVARKTGLIASIIGTLSNLLPKRIGFLVQAQDTMKNVQQQTNQTVTAVTSKVNSVDMLKSQTDSIAKNVKNIPGADKIQTQVQNNISGNFNDLLSMQDSSGSEMDPQMPSNLVFDEEVWLKNVGKTDENGGALNYAQSKTLQPGESMKVQIEIMNLSENPSAVSRIYKIEILQIPQTKLHITAPKQYVNGIVIFPKISRLEHVLPPIITVGMAILAAQLLALFSYLIF